MIQSRHLFGLTIAVTVVACGGPRAPRVAPTPSLATGTAEPAASGSAAVADSHVVVIPAPPLPSDSVQEALRLAMRAVELFGDSTLVSETTASSSAPSSSAGPASEDASWDIEVRAFVTQDRVDRYVKLFSGPARERFVGWLQRGRRYEPMIRSTFKARGVPEDMYYLGAVESGYDPHAVSRAYAVGMWQFMTSTARGFGLRVDWWIDERRDPMKSTEAAARFLAGLKDQFGSFYLAAAAYNGGPGRVKRGLVRYAGDLDDTNGEDCFFALVETGALRAETVNYVPQLIAAAYIAKDAAQFGVVLDSVTTPYVYDSVQVGPNVPLASVASAAGVPLETIRDLNPFVLRGVTPPSGPLVFVRVPPGSGPLADSVLGSRAADADSAYRVHVAKKGESMASVAKRFAISSRQLSWYNQGVKTGRHGAFATGQRLRIPSLDVLAGAFDVPDPAIERYGRSSGSRVHVVKRGESLGSIAKRYGTSVASIVRLNHLTRQVIFPGQTIIVGGSSGNARRARGTSTKAHSSGKRSAPAKKSAPKKKAASTKKAASAKR